VVGARALGERDADHLVELLEAVVGALGHAVELTALRGSSR
jgi:hypothetical protein